MLSVAGPKCLPYLGMYLSDLTYVDAALDSWLRPGIINLDKRRKEANILRVCMDLMIGVARQYNYKCRIQCV